MDDLKAWKELWILWNKYRLINRETAAAIRYTMEILEERIGRGEQG